MQNPEEFEEQARVTLKKKAKMKVSGKSVFTLARASLAPKKAGTERKKK